MCEYCGPQRWQVRPLLRPGDGEGGAGRVPSRRAAARPVLAPAVPAPAVPAPAVPAPAVPAPAVPAPAVLAPDGPALPAPALPAPAPPEPREDAAQHEDGPVWSLHGPAEPDPHRPAVPRGRARALLALLPVLLLGLPEPRVAGPLPPQVVADLLEPLFGTEADPVELRPLPALARLQSRNGYGEVRSVEYRCTSAEEVRVVAVSDQRGGSVRGALPMDEHRISRDSAAPILVCDGTLRTMLALLVGLSDAGAAPAEDPERVLLMTRTSPADRPTAIGAGAPGRAPALRLAVPPAP